MDNTPEEGGGASVSTDPAGGTSTATDVSLREYFWALRAADNRFHDERDRRYAEVDVEREKALKIKETADETARVLVAENQAYRDEKANELREQISSERGNYLPRDEYLTAHAAMIDRMTRSEAFQSKLLGAFALASVLIPLATGVVVYILTR